MTKSLCTVLCVFFSPKRTGAESGLEQIWLKVCTAHVVAGWRGLHQSLARAWVMSHKSLTHDTFCCPKLSWGVSCSGSKTMIWKTWRLNFWVSWHRELPGRQLLGIMEPIMVSVTVQSVENGSGGVNGLAPCCGSVFSNKACLLTTGISAFHPLSPTWCRHLLCLRPGQAAHTWPLSCPYSKKN
jgi:hypothetical protein